MAGKTRGSRKLEFVIDPSTFTPNSVMRAYTDAACPCCTEAVIRISEQHLGSGVELEGTTRMWIEVMIGRLAIAHFNHPRRVAKGMHFRESVQQVFTWIYRRDDLQNSSRVLLIGAFLESSGIKFKDVGDMTRVSNRLISQYTRPEVADVGLGVIEQIRLVQHFGKHLTCSPEAGFGNPTMDADLFLDATALFVELEGALLPCKVFRLITLMRRMGLRSDAYHTVFAQYGTTRLDDLIDLLERRILDRGSFAQLAENLDAVLVLAPTFTELEALIVAWRASSHHRLHKFIKSSTQSPRT